MMLPRRAVLGTAAGGFALSGTRRATAQGAAPVAMTTAGMVRGATDGGIHVFKGMHYGAPTGGAGRFRPPVLPAPWSGVRNALAFAPMCPQVVRGLPEIFASWTFDKDMSEDCLALNVWTPAVADGGKRPVMVWFHGGDFSSLSGSRNVFDGTRLAHKGRRRGCHPESPPQSVRLPPARAVRARLCRLWQCRTARPRPGTVVGPRQHRVLRR